MLDGKQIDRSSESELRAHLLEVLDLTIDAADSVNEALTYRCSAFHGNIHDAQKHCNADRHYAGFRARMKSHLETYKSEILKVKSGAAWNESSIKIWKPISHGRADSISQSGSVKFVVRGPHPDDIHEVIVENADEITCVEKGGYINIVNQAVSNSPSHGVRTSYPLTGPTQSSLLLELDRVVGYIFEACDSIRAESAGLRRSSRAIVDDHVCLLKQYNEMKDTGQQLIGLVAENRGVPVGGLYQTLEYGVEPSD